MTIGVETSCIPMDKMFGCGAVVIIDVERWGGDENTISHLHTTSNDQNCLYYWFHTIIPFVPHVVFKCREGNGVLAIKECSKHNNCI